MSLTERIAALTPEQRALFEKLRETKRQAARAHQPPPVRRLSGPDGAGDWPLSLDQERYWFMEQLRPSGAGLNLGTATRMRGPLSVPAFAAAFGEILRRHAAWRTTFPVLDGGPVQRVAVSRRQLLALVDVSGLPEERREAEALRLVGEDAAAPFDLERGPLVRTSLIRVSPRDHVCLLTAHHLIVDFLAFQIVWAELGALYAAFAAGGPAPLPEPPVHYSDFAVWQREWLQGEVLADLVSWWRERLAGFPLALDLPTDRPRPAVMRMRGGRRRLNVSRQLSEALRTLARQEGATLFMTVLATLAALLHRDSGQEKLILGANNANRNRPEIQPVVGTFLTQVPFPLDLSGDPTCRELLARVRQSALDTYAHQDLSFGKLVEAVQPQRDTSRQPIIQTLVQVLDGQPQRMDLAGVTFESIDAYDGNARYDLLLTLFDHPAGLSGSLEYDADLFDPATAERLCELFLLQAAAAAADPDLRLSALPALTPAARHQVLAEWSDTARPLPGWTVPERFAGWAARTPDALAVAAAGEELTFGELGRRADALAARLRAAGVGPESRVALLLDRTVDMPVALLAVWKAGGACVLLDPTSPPERLAALLADCEPTVVIHPGLGLEPSSPRPDGGEDGGREGALPRPGDLAYMIYTSGTTGLPKAVMVEHGSLAAVLDAVAGRFGFAPGDRMPHLARFSFDISLFELFAPLLGGGVCEILQQEEVLEPAALLEALERATRFHAVPSLMRQVAAWARAAGMERFAGLRTLFTGGDLVPPDLLVELGEVFPSAEVVVLYGPTEGTIVCTCYPVPPGARPERTLIGRPFANAGVRVIDRWGDAPLGVPGELWIGGPGVARGYFRRDELTAERFVEREGRRYYRTGDLVRHLADGTLEFLGRTDLQVKVRGFRVEPGEVEAALLAHSVVREAVVVARGNRLVAYVVAAAGAAPPVEEIRAFLRTRLPEYMVPGTFVPLAALPLSPNGKVDRKALPAPEPAGEVLAGSTPPRDAREERLAAIWREVLGLERVGVHDNFFQLGGDSILSIQVVARARREGLLVSPQQLFENQTIAGLAAVAGSMEDTGVDSEGPVEGPVEGEAPLTPIQRRFFAEERLEPWRFNQAVVLTPRERLAAAPLAAALTRLAGHHDALRLRFAREDGEWRQAHAPATAAEKPVPLLEIDLTALPPAERRGALDIGMERLQSGLDLARGPLFTAALFRLGEADRLLLTAHHLVVDGVSWRVLLEDLAAAYRGLELPAKTTSWKRWAELLAAHARSGELEEEIPYWLCQKPGAPLPVDLDGGGRGATASVAVELGPEETRALLQEAPLAYRTQVNDLLLAALVRAFAAWTGEGTLGIDLEGHGREEIFPGVDLSRTAGWFTTLFPVALSLPPGAGPREAIQGVKESLRAVPRHGLGYGLLRYLAGAETGERLAPLPAPQVSFNYLGRFDPAMGEGGLFAFAPEAPRGAGGEITPGRHLFAIDALVLGDRLRINWTYDPGHHLPATAERLARGFLAELAALIAHCLSPEAGGFTPSDFPLAGLGQAALDRAVGNDRGVEDLYPLAPMQQGMLFHSLYTAGADLYVEQLTAELAGPFDQAAFIAAWRRVVERHPALRTGFLWQEVEPPLQLVRRQAELPWTAEDWRGLPPAALETLWRNLLAADRARGFELDRPPLLRITLVRVGEEEHRLVWSSHHLLFDGWCFPLLLSEVFALYEAAAAGREALLPPPPRPYRDYIAWLAERDQAAAERYWRRALAGFTAPTPAPFDHPAALGGANGNHAGDYYERTVTLPASRAAGLESLAQRLQVTLNTLVQGAWALLLSRYAQASDVVFGAVVSGRPAELAGVESMVGLFINSLPVRVEIPQDEAASSWLARLQAGQFEQSQYAWTPLARIQAFSEVPAGEPLFTSLLAFQNYPLDPAVSERLSELRINDVALSERTNYPLTLAAVARGELALRLTADRRFEPATTRRMLAHLENLLNALAADPERPPRFLPLLAAAERHQLTVEWSDTARPLPEWTVPGRFADQAAATPEALALVAGGESLTFAALDGRAEELAGRLRAAGVATGSRVALLLDRTAEMPAALLAVWKAGGVCVPLDPASPAERLATLLADAEPAVLIHRGLDLEAFLPVPRGRGPEGALPRPEHLAYMIYTSGTTGLPKAVMVEHGGLAAVLAAVLDRFGFGPGDRMPHLARFSFDISLLELFAPLLGGGACEILDQEEILDPAALMAALARATRFHAVPSLMRQVAAAARESGPERFAGLRTLFTGGDRVPPDLLAELRRAFPAAEIVVLYGPTEATIVCTYHPVPPEAPLERALIGRPFDNVEVRVVDRGEDLPPGAPGELWIGGPGVARGYFRREELTADRFVEREGKRYYRTGDLVRRLADGTLEFLGRTDLQVKIRGFRVEPGEIEIQLAAHPGVREAVVVARAGTGADARLVAYVVAAGAAVPAGELQAFLRDRLPEYMVPAAFVVLPALPLTPNGKVDLRALPAPETAREGSAGSTPPRDAREERLAAIWRGVLGLERVGVHDNFFQLGGDSILSIQVVARARREGLLITPRQLFENQTIAGLAAVAGSMDDAVAPEGPVEGEAPLTPIQRRFLAEERREPWRFNQAVALTPRERLAAAPLAAALARLAGHHDALRLRFAREDGEWRQVHAPAAPVPFLEVDLTALPPEQRSRGLDTAMERLQSGLDLARGPLFTAALFRLAEEDRLLLTAHHLVVDAVSWRVLLEDLAAAYRGLELPAKTTSWKRWAELLAAHARSGELEEEIPYWLSRKPGPPLPVDLDGDGRGATASVSVELGPEETAALLKEVPEVYRTQVNDLLLAALVRAFAAWTGEGTLGIDLEGHGREEIFPGVDLSRTAGWFTTLFPVALSLPPGAGPREAIQGTKETLRAVPRRGLGYGLLRYLATPEIGERLAALPAPQVSFNYLGRFDPAMGEGGLFAFAPEAPRGAGGEITPGRHLFAIDALVLGDRLRINWTYDPGRHLPATAERLAHSFRAELAALIAHCLLPEAGGFTPSDFPLAGLGQAALDRVVGNDRGVEDLYPLAPMQQGMLFHSLYTAGADLYVEQLTAELAGPFDQAAFIAAWRRVVERHGALRTGFLWQEVEPPLQLVRRQAELPWTAEDWRGLPPAALESRWRDLLTADRARGFALDRPPLLRITLVRVGEEEHRLVWSSHHLLFDGWCFPLLLSEVFALYEAAVAGREAHLPPPPRPYRDYIAWLAERDQAAAERYWGRALAGFTVPTPAPFDHPAALGGADGSHAGDYYERTLTLPASRTAGLESLAQRLQVTLNTLVQGAWALLLSRYAQSSDVVFGAVVSGRPAELAGVESMVGLFINSLPVRVEIPQDETASSWLARLQAGQFEQSRYAWTPLARIQAFSEVPAGEPLFTSLLAFQNYPLDPAVSERLSELRINDVALSDHTNYPLTLSAVARGELALRLTADRRFEPATTRRMLAHLENLLGALAAGPERPPRSLPLLAAAERHQLTVEWNDTATSFPEVSIPALFAEQAARRPEALALLGPGREDRLSYGELDRRAGALARELARQGIGRGDLVGLFAERSAELVIAVLAILKSGAAYLPLDPSYPRERLALMLADGGAPLVLVQPGLAALLPAGAARTLPLVPSAFEGAPWSGSTTAATAADLAYVVYTSGSTGTPKGVAVTHRSVVRLVRDTDYADFGPDQVFLMMAPVSFDASTFELWGPLLNGGCLAILPPGEVTLDGLERAIHDSGVTTLWLTAGLFHLVVDERLAALAPLRQLLAGGDVLSPPHVARLRRELPGLRLVNGYGPTENTTFTTVHRVERVAGASVPIGRPIANTRVLVLGRDLEPAPIGVPGELHAGGAGLAVGYLGRPALTAAAFVPALFGEQPGERPGERLYRTGDLARRLPDGSLDFLGRADRQVKVRGFRIEPGEIEAALADHPAVREAAVVASRDDGRERRLVACAVPRGAMAAAPPAEAVLADLAARLPAYMIPAELIWLDVLPLSPTGKVDRAALAAMALAVERGEAVDLTPPRDAVEEALAAIWRQVLGCERVGVHDNFFRLGGDSILSIQIVARARQAGLVVTPRQIFEEQTIAALAAVATPLAAAEPEPGAVEGDVPPTGLPLAGLDQQALDALAGTGPSRDLTIEDLYPLAPLQQGMLFEGLFAPDSELYFQQLIAEMAGPLDTGAFVHAWQAVVDRHPALRTAFAWEGLKRPLQVVRRGVRLPWTEEDWRQVPPQEVPERLAAWLAADRARSFDLARPPLMRAALLRTGEDRLWFVWSFHHLLLDGWCLSLIFREVFALYRAAVAGRDALLPAVRPYRDFIAWVARQDAAATDDFFRRQLAGFTAPTRLPLDRPALPALSADDDGAPPDQVLRLPPALVARLIALAQSRELTLNTLAQGAWALLLARHGGAPDVVFGTVVSGRPAELPGVESMIGLFINTLPVRLAADPASPLDVWLAGVQKHLLELRQHETAALAQIQRASEVPPGEPLFQSIVAFENFPVDESLGEGAGEIAFSGVTVTGRTDYPLSFAVMPGRRDGNELSLSLSHDRRTDATTARRLLGHLERLLDAFAAFPGSPLGELPVLSAAERHQLVLEWNDTAPETAEDLCLHDLMSVQARRLPAAVALSGVDREMTYAELDRRTNQLANHLGALGVGPESRVAIMVERSLEMVVAVLGILKAGGAYVPIDPAMPADRLDFLLADARPALLLAGEGVADRSREAAVAVVALDAERERIDAASAEPPAVVVDPENLAYVIYTSGSTGTPKGVAVRHRSAVAYARAVAREYGMRTGDRELQFASLSFDASVEEIFAPLAAGATVVPRRGPAEEPARFLAGCAELGITVLSLPTAYWHQIAAAVESGETPLPPALRLIVMGGERALPERWTAWGRGPGRRVRLVNAYGPTEATVAATLHEHPGTPDPLAGRREVPIGRPLAGVRAQVVDRDLRPVPAGGIGELVLGGVGVARGYLGRPGLTAERFVPDPLSGEPGARLYRTGDLVQLLPDGTLEFAGRLDDQVKVRGFRIEPGEIEAVLATHPGLREAAVVVHRGDSLLACVVPADAAAPPAIAELRAFLAERLPAHMVPTAYAVLPALPLTSSDKVDRRALARQERVIEPAGERVAPATPLEELLARAAAEVLGVDVERVGMRDNFFDLGGHSLLATQLVSQLSQGHGIQVTLQMVFDASDLGELADRIVEAELARVDSGLLDEALLEMEGMSPEEIQDLLGGAGGLEEDD